jgi:hypothetical protein
MNKRIFELLKQATTDVNPEDREWVFSRVDQAKFAELMLTEFKSVLLDMINKGQGEFDTLDQALTEINEHFGVEE